MGTEAKFPELLAKRRGILIQKASELYLQRLDVRLSFVSIKRLQCGSKTDKSRALDQVEAKLNDDIVLTP